MKIHLSFLAVLALAVSCHAQTAKVVALSAADAAEAKRLYAQQDSIALQIRMLREKIIETYLVSSKEDSTHTRTLDNQSIFYAGVPGSGVVTHHEPMWVSTGWGFGEFTFSDDFRFIVPDTTTSKPFNSGITFDRCPTPGWSGSVFVAN